MKIKVGSLNCVKIQAAKESIEYFFNITDNEVTGVETQSGVSNQPKSIDETILGAINRAKSAYRDCHISIGLEDGLMEVPYTRSGYMNVCACAIYDGHDHYIGLGPSFEYPSNVIQSVKEEGLDITQAFNNAGLTKSRTMGSENGAIGVLTCGKINRKDYSKQAVHMALINYLNERAK